MKTILAAVDGSAGAERALQRAVELSRAFNAKLVIATVSELADKNDLRKFGEAEHAQIGDILEAESRKLLMRARSAAEQERGREVTCRSKAGDPAGGILEVAAETKADVIVAGKRGRGQLAGLLLGSVSQKLVSLAPCAVMIVP